MSYFFWNVTLLRPDGQEVLLLFEANSFSEFPSIDGSFVSIDLISISDENA